MEGGDDNLGFKKCSMTLDALGHRRSRTEDRAAMIYYTKQYRLMTQKLGLGPGLSTQYIFLFVLQVV